MHDALFIGPPLARGLSGITLALYVSPERAEELAQDWEAARLADLALCERLAAEWDNT